MYKVICADPPWQYKHKSLNRGGAERQAVPGWDVFGNEAPDSIEIK